VGGIDQHFVGHFATLGGGGRVWPRALTAPTDVATVHLIRGLGEGRNAIAGAPPNRFPAEPNARRSNRSASVRVFPGVRSAT
jgi:hypothetical protein